MDRTTMLERLRVTHRDLIDDMALEIPDVRPAVVDESLANVLGECLRFRHVFRHCGGVSQTGRMAPLEERLRETLTAFRHHRRVRVLDAGAVVTGPDVCDLRGRRQPWQT